MTACQQHARHIEDDTMSHYAGTVHHRLERAIANRDELFVALNQPQTNDTADDAMSALDSILINLAACLDVTARVVNVCIGSPAAPHLVGWRRRQWREVVGVRSTDVRAVLDDPAFNHLVSIVGELRNTIHGAALDPLAIGKPMSRDRDDTLVGLPADRLTELLVAVDALGGRESWGIRPVIAGRAHAHLDVLCERLLAGVVDALNRIMKATPVEDLPGVSLTHDDDGPGHAAGTPFDPTLQRNLLAQYGFAAPT